MNIYPTCYIISAYTGAVNDHIMHKHLGNDLKTQGAVKELAGVYKGKKEECWLFIPDHDNKNPEITVQVIAKTYKQECVLKVDGSREAWYLDSRIGTEPKHIGPFRSVTKQCAEKLDAYTIDNNYYYAAEPRMI